MNAKQMFVRAVLGSVLIMAAMGEITLCAGEEAAVPEAEAAARGPRRGAREQREWGKLHEELAAEGLGRETWRELFEKKQRGEPLEAKEVAALQRIQELKERMDPGHKVLDRWVGTWLSDVIINPCAWLAQGKQQSGIKEVKWILNGRFQESTVRSDGYEAREIQRYEPYAGQRKKYYKWVFSTERSFGQSYWTGTWDEESKAMTWELDYGAVKGTMVESFADPDADRYDTTLVLKDAEGKVLLDIQAEHTRVLKK